MSDAHAQFLDSLPKDWERARLDELGSIHSGSTPSRSVPSYWGGDIPWVTPGELTGLRAKYLEKTADRITAAGLASCSATVVPRDALLVTTRATIGSVALAAVPMTTNQGFRSIVFNSQVHPHFYYHLFPKLVSEIIRRASGTTFLEISGREFSAVEVPVPPLPEQRRIAEVLDTLDEAIRRTEEIIAKLQRMKGGLLHDLLKRGIGENGELRPSSEVAPKIYKDSPLGQIPREWDSDCLEKRSSLIVPMRDKPKKLDGEIPWIRIEDFDGKYLTGSKSGQGVTSKTVRAMNLKVMPPGTVLCSCSCDMGVTAIVQRELVTNQTFIGVVPNSDTDAGYLYYLLNFSKNKLNNLSTGTTIRYLPRRVFESLHLPFPPLPEQRRIAKILDNIDKTILREREEKDKLRTLKQGLMDDLLTGRVRVKVEAEAPA